MKNRSHETDSPSVPAHGHQEVGLGCSEFKGQAMDIAYGQAGKGGVQADAKKVQSQMKHYDWESPSEY